jgi:hypothetical protein
VIIDLKDAVAGDLVFFDSPGKVAWALKVAQRIRWRGNKNHVAWLDRFENGSWYIGQAEGSGVTIDKKLELGIWDRVTNLPPGCSHSLTLEFLRAQVGRKYGFLTIVSIFLTLLSPKFVNVMAPDTWICSAVIGEGVRFGGWYHPWPDIYQVAPDQLWSALP